MGHREDFLKSYGENVLDSLRLPELIREQYRPVSCLKEGQRSVYLVRDRASWPALLKIQPAGGEPSLLREYELLRSLGVTSHYIGFFQAAHAALLAAREPERRITVSWSCRKWNTESCRCRFPRRAARSRGSRSPQKSRKVPKRPRPSARAITESRSQAAPWMARP